jgi:hypothetical protein
MRASRLTAGVRIRRRSGGPVLVVERHEPQGRGRRAHIVAHFADRPNERCTVFDTDLRRYEALPEPRIPKWARTQP